MSNEQKQEAIFQLTTCAREITKGLENLRPSDTESAAQLVCALKEMLHTAEELTGEG